MTGGGSSGTFAGFGNFSLSGGGTLGINTGTSNSWENTGSITVTNSTVDLGGTFTQANLTAGSGTFSHAGSTVNIDGTLSGGLTLDASTGSWNLAGSSTLSGGTFSASGGATLVAMFFSSLSGVTLDSPIDMTTDNPQLFVYGDLTLNNITLDVAGGQLDFGGNGTQNIAGTGSIVFGNIYGAIFTNNGETVKLGAGVLVDGPTGTIGGNGAFVNDGTINANGSGGTITIGGPTFTNNGTVEGTSGGTLSVNPTTLTNFSGGTLSGGTWRASGGGIMRFNGDDITTNAATIVLDGASSHFYDATTGTTDALAGLATNAAAGSLAIQNGYNFAAPGIVFTNHGAVAIGAGGTFTFPAGGSYNQYGTGAATVLNGGTIDIPPQGVVIQAGTTLSGSGTIDANVTMSGTLEPGGAGTAGTVTINGNYTQTSTGTLAIDVGGTTAGTQYSQLNVSGTATLAGTLAVNAINGFTAAGGQSFRIVTSAADGGTFSAVSAGTDAPAVPAYLSREVVLATTPAIVVTTTADGPLATTPSATLTGLSVPYTLAFDAHGNLFVANTGANTVSEFAPGATTASATLTGLSDPRALAFDSSGDLYVANYVSNGTVSEFAPGATTPSATLTGLSYPEALAFDSSGNLYVANNIGSTVSKFAPGATTASATLTGLDRPSALAFDSSGNLFVANEAAGTVSEFAPGATTASATLSGLSGPQALAFDSSGDLFVANAGGNTVSEFTPGAATASATLTGLNQPQALAFDPSGNLYVANDVISNGTVSEFAPGATTAGATLTGLSQPAGLAFDAGGNLYVANSGANTVSEFAATHGVTLRQAILEADAGSASITPIYFDIPGSGVQSIQPLSALPAITKPVVIDATTQGGYAGTPIVQLSGINAGGNANGLTVGAGGGGSTIRGLVINAFSGNGIELDAGGNTVAGNFIGTNATGTAPLARNAYQFNGGNVAANIPQLNTTTGAQNTVSFWMKWDGTNTQMPIAFGFNGNTYDLELDNGYLAFNTGNNDLYGVSSAALANQWHLITAIFTNGNVSQNQLWIDGVQQTLSQVLGTPSANSVTNLADVGGTAGYYFSGELNQFAFFNQALTATQIQAQYAARANGTYNATVIGQGPVAYYPMNETSGTVAVDSSGYGNNGAISASGVTLGAAGQFVQNANGILITSANNTIGGTTAAARNVISGNVGDGVQITGLGATGNVVEGDYIGIDAAGTAALFNNASGVEIVNSPSNTVGGATAGARNVISGNSADGVNINGSASTGNAVEGNYIGTDATGSVALANGTGGGISDAGGATTIGAVGAGNVISGNTGGGISVFASGDTIVANYIGTNATGTAAIANGYGGITDTAGATTIGAVGAGNVISGNTQSGIAIASGATGDTIVANLIGTNAAGTAAVANGGAGIVDAGGRTTIGALGAGNVISGNAATGIQITAAGDTIVANFIGTNAAGTAAVANGGSGGIADGGGKTTIGAVGAGNVISGNTANGIDVEASGDTIVANLIGTDVTGTLALGNADDGVLIAAGAASNTIGGAAVGAGNVIAANGGSGVEITGAGSNGNVVDGNFIGTDAAGTASTDANGHALGNTGDGVFVNNGAQSNIIGGATSTAPGVIAPGVGSVPGLSTAYAGNLIAGNLGNGVNIDPGVIVPPTSLNVVEGNFIGTDVTGVGALANGLSGVQIANASSNTIGGTAHGSGNLISGNAQFGVYITGSSATGNTVEGDYIGTNAAGTSTLGTQSDGVQINGSSGDTIGGTSAGSGNLISGNVNYGLILVAAGATGNLVEGNDIGTDASGTLAVPNYDGIYVEGAAGNTVGGTAAGAGNVISGNTSDGVFVDAASSANTFAGNFIGTNAAGAGADANGANGVEIDGPNNTIGGTAAGAGNVIAYNLADGVSMSGASTTNNAVRGNNIYSNGALGIDLTSGATTFTPIVYPVIQSIVTRSSGTTIAGSFTSTPNTTYALDFFANPSGGTGAPQGQSFLGTVTVATDSTGVASFSATLPGGSVASDVFDSTVTVAGYNTSEFSPQLTGFTPSTDIPPVVSITGTTTGPASLPAAFSSTVTDASPSASSYTYAWSVTETGNPSFALPAGIVTSQPTFQFTPSQTGTYQVSLTVTDSQGGAGTATSTLTVDALAPAVVISGPLTGGANAPVTFNSTVTTLPGGAVASYAWTATDSSGIVRATGAAASFTFTPVGGGFYTIALAVTDADGGLGRSGTFLSVSGAAPTAAILAAPAQSAEGAPITLSAAPPDANLSGALSYAWNVYKDASTTAYASGNQAAFTFTPNDEGSYQVTLAVSSLGHTGIATPMTVLVGDATPTASIANAPASAPAGAQVTLSGSGGTPGTLDQFSDGNVTLAWSVMNSNGVVEAQGTGASILFTPGVAGLDVVTLTATSDGGHVGTTSAMVEITQALNPLVLTQQGTASEGGTASFSAGIASPPSGVTFTFAWSVTGETTPYANSGAGTPAGTVGSNFTFVPPAPGTYQVSVTATGSDGTKPSASQVVNVVNVPPAVTITGTPAAGTPEGTPLNLTALASDPGGAADHLLYAWTVSGPDGFTLTGGSPTISFTPVEWGGYSASVAVTDSSRATTSASTSFTIAHVTPTPVIQNAAPIVVDASGNSTISLSAVATDPGGDEIANNTFTYAWTALNPSGTTIASQTSASANFSLTENSAGGTYTVKLTVTDDDGGSGATTAVVLIAQPNTILDLTSAGTTPNVPAGATQVVALALANAKIDASALPATVAVDEAAVGGGNSTLGSSGSSGTLSGGGGNDTLMGGNDTLIGGPGANVLQGDSSFNLLMGGSGPNTMYASANDTLMGGSGSNSNLFQIAPAPGEVAVAGATANTLSFSQSTSGVTFNLADNTGAAQMLGAGGGTLALSGAVQTLLGSAGADQLFAAPNSTVYGGGGNDTLMANGGSNIGLVAGAGNVLLQANNANNVALIGGSGSDSLFSSGGTSTTMTGGSGNDTLTSSGGTGASMTGGTGNDSLFSSGGTSTTMTGGGGNDTLASSGGTSTTMTGGTGNDSLFTSGGTSTTMVGGGGNDTLGSSGGTSTSMTGGTGNDSLFSSGGTSTTMVGGGGNDTLTSSGGSGGTMVGGTGNDSLFTSSGTSTTMTGGSGNDTLTSNSSTSTSMIGGTGNDSLFTSGGGSTTMIGGSGNDTLSSTSSTSTTMVGGTGNDSLFTSGGTSTTMYGGSGNDTLTSSSGTSALMIGGTGNDSLFTSSGTSTTMVGGSGNDTLSSTSSTSTTMVGGTGNDSLFTSSGSSTTMVGGGGNDTLTSSSSTSTSMIGGTGNDSLFTSSGTSTTMVGGSGNDTLASSGSTSTTMVGGTGNDSLFTSSGSSTTMVGGSGNDTLTSSGSTSTSMVGGTGNDSLFTSGGTSTTMVGGSGNDTLTSTSSTSTSMVGGTGNDSLFTSGGSSTTMVGGGGNDTLTSTSSTSTTMTGGTGNDSLFTSNDNGTTVYGGAGNDTLLAAGGTNIALYGLEGDNTYQVTGSAADPVSVSLNDLNAFGQSQAVADGPTPGVNTIVFPGVSAGITLDLSNASNGAAITPAETQQVAPGITLSITGQFNNVVGTPGNDFIRGDGVSNVLSGGATGNDTLVGGSGPATLVAGSGNDSLVAGTGGTTFQFPSGSGGNVTIDPPTPAANTLDFSQFGGPVTLNMASTSPQTLSSTLTLTLANATAVNGLIDGAFNDSITGNTLNDRFHVGSGNDTFSGGGGNDSYFFAGAKLGADTINESTTNNALNFSGFGAGINLNLTQAGSQTLSHDAATGANLALTLANPAAFSTVVGTPYSDTIVGNSNAQETLIGGGGGDSLVGGGGADYIQGNVTQVVYLDFNETPLPGSHVYTPAEQAAIQARLEHDYAAFNYAFTQDPAQAAQLAAAGGGSYATLIFNQGPAGGASNQLDFRNLNLSGRTTININPFLGDPNSVAADLTAGLVPGSSANIINLTAEIAAHELGHLSGLRHSDAMGPIVDANGNPAGIYAGVNAGNYYPAYSGPANATETPEHIMASPGSMGTTLLQAAGLDSSGNPTQPTYFGEREAVKLAFNDTGTVVQQADLPTQTLSSSLAQNLLGASTGTAYTLGTLPSLAVPNTLENPSDVGYGKTFNVQAIDVNAAITTPTQADFYAFSGTAGQVFQFEVISATNTSNPNPFQAELEVTDSTGTRLAYNGSPYGAYALHDFESPDPTLLDVVLPATGTYYVGVDAFFRLTGNYQLFMYSFATGPASVASSGGGDTLVGGGGADTLVGSSGNDLFTFLQNSAGNATLLGGSGQDLVNLNPAPNEHVTASGNVTFAAITTITTLTVLNASPNPSVYDQTVTFDATVTPTGGTPTGSVEFEDGGALLGSAALGANGQAQFSTSFLVLNHHSITAVYIPTGNFVTSTGAVDQLVNQATPTVTVTDAGGTYNGLAFTAGDTVAGVVAGVDNTPAASLQSVAPSLTYYVGATVSGTALPGAPSQAGTYTVLASFAGSTDYTSASASATFTITPAALTITANNQSKIHGQANPVFTDTITGFVNGDTASVVAGAASLATTAVTSSAAGTYTITAGLGTLSAADYTFMFTNGTLTVLAFGAASQLVFTSPPANTTAGQAINAPAGVQVSVEDQFGNVVTTDSSSVSIAIGSVAPAPGSAPAGFVGGTLSVAAASGVATFSNLVLDQAGAYTLSAGDTDNSVALAAGASASFTVSPAAAGQLAFTSQPTATTAGGAIDSPTGVKVSVEDKFGNVVTTDSSSVSIAIGSVAPAPGSAPAGFVGGTLSVAAASGVATFSNLVLDQAGAYTLSAGDTDNSVALAAATSTSFLITPAAASQLVFTVQPTTRFANHFLNPGTGVVVAVEDQFGNVVTTDSSTVAMAVASGPAGGAFTPSSVTSAAASSGVATYSSLALNLSGTYTLSAGDGSLTGATSAPFAITPNTGLLLLDPTGQGALNVNGSGSFSLSGLGAIVVDSSSAGAVNVAGHGAISASELDITGAPGVANDGTGTVQGVVNAGVAATADPLASLPAPAQPATVGTAVNYSGTVTLQPGTYVGGIHVSGTSNVTLISGIYYLEGGGFVVSGGATVTGNGVMLYNATGNGGDNGLDETNGQNDGAGGIHVRGNASVTLTPPTSGTYEGVAIFQARTLSIPVRLAGDATWNIAGTVYVPTAAMHVSGHETTDNAILVGGSGAEFIAQDMFVSGHASFTLTADAGNRSYDPNAMLVAGGPAAHPSGMPPLTLAEVAPVLQQALADWQAAGIDAATLAAMAQVTIHVTTLPAPYLGQAAPGSIWLDSTAEGYGWFTGGSSATPPAGEIDLLTVVSHELGHLIGLQDGDGAPLMAQSLAPGVRIVPSAADLLAAHTTLAEPPEPPTGGLRPPLAPLAAPAPVAGSPAGGSLAANLLGGDQPGYLLFGAPGAAAPVRELGNPLAGASTGTSLQGVTAISGSLPAADDDILIGGEGTDLMIGGAGQSLLVGGIGRGQQATEASAGIDSSNPFDDMADDLVAAMNGVPSGSGANHAGRDEFWADFETNS
ncbi:MAG TPA: PKD domain-containing protein [Pirellulales bacterium]|nr:PKD domain-containing protein [Pirellulales bacterium]